MTNKHRSALGFSLQTHTADTLGVALTGLVFGGVSLALFVGQSALVVATSLADTGASRDRIPSIALQVAGPMISLASVGAFLIALRANGRGKRLRAALVCLAGLALFVASAAWTFHRIDSALP